MEALQPIADVLQASGPGRASGSAARAAAAPARRCPWRDRRRETGAAPGRATQVVKPESEARWLLTVAGARPCADERPAARPARRAEHRSRSARGRRLPYRRWRSAARWSAILLGHLFGADPDHGERQVALDPGRQADPAQSRRAGGRRRSTFREVNFSRYARVAGGRLGLMCLLYYTEGTVCVVSCAGAPGRLSWGKRSRLRGAASAGPPAPRRRRWSSPPDTGG